MLKLALSPDAGRFGYLTAAILAMLLLRPFLDDLPGVELVTDLLFLAIFISGCHAARHEKWRYRLALALAFSGLAARIAHAESGAAPLYYLAEGLTALFFVNAGWSLAAHIRSAREVTRDLIAAAVSAYLLLGMIWAYADLFLEAARPGSFKASEPLAGDSWAFIYFSFVTLTSLGYGDIVAATKPARSFAIVEVVVGQLYLAILVGRLVGAYSAEFRGAEKPD